MRIYFIFVLLTSTMVFSGCGGGGDHSSPPPVVSISVTPPSAIVPASGVQQFAATVTGTSNKTATWTVAGAGCAGAACGTIDAAGLYTTPATVPSPATVTVTATSQADSKKSNSATVTITDSHNPRLKGRYAFAFKGFDANGGVAAAGSFSADGLGRMTNGVQDVSRFTGVNTSLSFTGTYVLGTDNRGTFTLTNSLGSTNYSFTLDSSGDGHFIELGTNGSSGSGILKLQDQTSFSTAAIAGDYAFGFAGLVFVPMSASYPFSEVGRFHADGAGNLSNGVMDAAAPGSTMNSLNLAGSYAVPNVSSDGRGTAVLQTPIPGTNGTFNFAFYILSPNEQFFISIDAPSPSLPQLSGRVAAQLGGPFSNASLNGTVIFNQSGPTVVPTASVSIGEITADGAGNLTGAFDQNDNGTISSNVPFTGNYVIGADGRGTLNFMINPPFAVPSVFYLAGSNTGFLLEGPAMNGPSQALSGSFEEQSPGPFGPSLLVGDFFLGTITPATADTLNLSGVLGTDGAGGLTGTVDVGFSEGNNVDQPITGNYALASDGRGTLTLISPGANTVFYAISPQKLVAIDVDGAVTGAAVIALEK